jgi:hypothetical protein
MEQSGLSTLPRFELFKVNAPSVAALAVYDVEV